MKFLCIKSKITMRHKDSLSFSWQEQIDIGTLLSIYSKTQIPLWVSWVRRRQKSFNLRLGRWHECTFVRKYNLYESTFESILFSYKSTFVWYSTLLCTKVLSYECTQLHILPVHVGNPYLGISLHKVVYDMGILNNMMSDNLTDEIDIVSSKVRTSVSRSVRNRG